MSKPKFDLKLLAKQSRYLKYGVYLDSQIKSINDLNSIVDIINHDIPEQIKYKVESLLEQIKQDKRFFIKHNTYTLPRAAMVYMSLKDDIIEYRINDKHKIVVKMEIVAKYTKGRFTDTYKLDKDESDVTFHIKIVHNNSEEIIKDRGVTLSYLKLMLEFSSTYNEFINRIWELLMHNSTFTVKRKISKSVHIVVNNESDYNRYMKFAYYRNRITKSDKNCFSFKKYITRDLYVYPIIEDNKWIMDIIQPYEVEIEYTFSTLDAYATFLEKINSYTSLRNINSLDDHIVWNAIKEVYKENGKDAFIYLVKFKIKSPNDSDIKSGLITRHRHIITNIMQKMNQFKNGIDDVFVVKIDERHVMLLIKERGSSRYHIYNPRDAFVDVDLNKIDEHIMIPQNTAHFLKKFRHLVVDKERRRFLSRDVVDNDMIFFFFDTPYDDTTLYVRLNVKPEYIYNLNIGYSFKSNDIDYYIVDFVQPDTIMKYKPYIRLYYSKERLTINPFLKIMFEGGEKLKMLSVRYKDVLKTIYDSLFNKHRVILGSDGDVRTKWNRVNYSDGYCLYKIIYTSNYNILCILKVYYDTLNVESDRVYDASINFYKMSDNDLYKFIRIINNNTFLSDAITEASNLFLFNEHCSIPLRSTKYLYKDILNEKNILLITKPDSLENIFSDVEFEEIEYITYFFSKKTEETLRFTCAEYNKSEIMKDICIKVYDGRIIIINKIAFAEFLNRIKKNFEEINNHP